MKLILSAVALAGFFAGLSTRADDPAIVLQEFIYERGPYPSVHASTIVEATWPERVVLTGGRVVEGKAHQLVAAWFGGTHERAPDVGIWVSRRESGGGLDTTGWTSSVEVANGLQPDGTRYPTWNPVLFQPRGGPLMLFYKVGPSPEEWWGMLRTSTDGGRSWSDARRLPDDILGPIKTKPVQLADGTIVAGSSTESHAEPSRWQVHFERSSDSGKTWSATPPINEVTTNGAIHHSILFREKIGGSKLLAVGRSELGKVFSTTSDDGGKTWSALSLIADLPNPNAGIDAVTLRDGRQLIVYNPVPHGRTPLAVAVSRDGRRWKKVLTLEDQPGEYSYPAVIQTADGLVHITYTWKRQRVKHVVVDPSKLVSAGRRS
jgi:predicted neuraminidase